jgi:hypothetical protein
MLQRARVRLLFAVLGLALAVSMPIRVHGAEIEPCFVEQSYQCCYYSDEEGHHQCEGLDPGCGCLQNRLWTLN